MIYPTRAAILLTAAGGLPAIALGVLAPGLWLAGPAWVALMLALMLADAAMAVGRPETVVMAPRLMGVGGEGEVTLEARFPRAAPAAADLALEADPRLGLDATRRRARIEGSAGGAVFHITPSRRGEGALTRAWVRWRGPLGLVWRQAVTKLDAAVGVIPNIAGVKKEALRLFSRDARAGIKLQIDTGEGAEFQSLREFQPGMDRRTVDWKQSARHAMLLAKEFRTEKNHQVVMAVDSGRGMGDPVGGMARLDHALNAALTLAYVSLKMGDRASIYGFDDKPRLHTAPVSGVGAFPVMQALAARIDYSTEETNYTLGLSHLSGQLERRALVVLFTDFTDTTSAELMLENLRRLIKRHLILFVVLRDEELEDIIRAEPNAPEDVARAVTASGLLKERDLVITRLRRMGVHVVDAPARSLGPDLLNAYVDLKRRDLL